MAMVVRAFPLCVPRKEVEAFAAKVRERHAETTAFYRKYGLAHESWYLQEVDGKAWVICCSAMKDPEAGGKEYAAATDSFGAWFKNEVTRLSGVNPNHTPLGPPSHQLFSWDDPAAPTNLA